LIRKIFTVKLYFLFDMPKRFSLLIPALALCWLAGSPGLAQTAELRPDTFLKDSDLMQFITVEAYEVRIELIARCQTLVKDLNFPLADPAVISPREQQSLIEQAMPYFGRQFTFFPQGVPVPPAGSNGDILRLGAIDSVVAETLVVERLSDAVLGIAYTYPLDASIRNFEFAWNRMPGSAERIPVVISTPAGMQIFEFSDFVLSLDWSAESDSFQLPEIEPLPVRDKTWLGRPQLTRESAKSILTQLIIQIYQAFEYPTEAAIYDSLAQSVTGAELSAIYLEYRARIEAIRRGGPSVRILSVVFEDIGTIRRKDKNFVMEASWRVLGKVRHFGHIHNRMNRYRAALTLTAEDDSWKLLKIEILEESRVQ